MISAWTDNLKDPEEKNRFKDFVLGSKPVLDRLANILTTMKTDIESKERSTKTYELPNWDYRQAHVNGFMDCLNKIQILINLDQQENERPIQRQRPA